MGEKNILQLPSRLWDIWGQRLDHVHLNVQLLRVLRTSRQLWNVSWIELKSNFQLFCASESTHKMTIALSFADIDGQGLPWELDGALQLNVNAYYSEQLFTLSGPYRRILSSMYLK